MPVSGVLQVTDIKGRQWRQGIKAMIDNRLRPLKVGYVST